AGFADSCAVASAARSRKIEHGRIFTEAPCPRASAAGDRLGLAPVSVGKLARIFSQERKPTDVSTERSFAVVISVDRSQEVERIVGLINAAFRRSEGHIICGDRIDSEEVRSLLPKGEFLVAEDDGKLLGCVYLEPREERTYLGLLSVSPDLQKQGVGSMLM